MRFGWARAGALVLLAAVAACGRGDPNAQAERQQQAAAFFLKTNAAAPGVITLPSGLQYKVTASGPSGGISPDGDDLVRVEYEGSLTNGEVFDSTYERGQPAVFTPEEVIPGWREVLQRMKVGDEWIVYVPPELGYKDRQAGPIPPHSVLVFRLKLLDVAHTPGAPSAAATANG